MRPGTMFRPLSSRSRFSTLLILCGAIAFTVGLVIFIRRVLAFAHLFGIFGPHSGIRITQRQVADAHALGDKDPRIAVVPKILHQIFQNWNDPGNTTLPSHWEAARQSCIDLNPGWEFKVRGIPPRRRASALADAHEIFRSGT